MGVNGKNSADHKTPSTSRAGLRLPPLKALLAFEAAARHGSFARGAVESNVTPSAISHHVQQLEEFLGIALFERHGGRALLTAAGSVYAKEIEHAFGLIAAATELVAPKQRSDSLFVASALSFATKWLQPRLCDFLTSNPSLKIRLATLGHAKDLDEGGFDLAICYGTALDSHRRAEPLIREKLRPLCSPRVANSLDLRTPACLSRATVIHSANSLTWAEYLRRIGFAGIRPNHELWFDRSTMAIDAAARGLGLVLESEILAEQELREGSLVAPFPDPALQVELTTYYLVRPSGSRNQRAKMLFERWLRAAISSVASQPA